MTSGFRNDVGARIRLMPCSLDPKAGPMTARFRQLCSTKRMLKLSENQKLELEQA